MSYVGRNVGVAIIDSGIDPNMIDLDQVQFFDFLNGGVAASRVRLAYATPGKGPEFRRVAFAVQSDKPAEPAKPPEAAKPPDVRPGMGAVRRPCRAFNVCSLFRGRH